METQLRTIVLFGEAERGEYKTAYFCQTLPQLADFLGNPPPFSVGLYYAVQALLYRQNLLFFRVREEGYSQQDYLLGLHMLQEQHAVPHISAICLPGVGDMEIIHAMTPFCKAHHSVIITTEPDLYDYLTHLTAVMEL